MFSSVLPYGVAREIELVDMFLQRGLSTQGLQSELIVKKFERTLYERFVSENLYFLIYSHYEVYNIEVI